MKVCEKGDKNGLNPFATVIVFFVDFYVCPTIMVPYSRVAHRYLGTPSLPNENLKYLKRYSKVPSVAKGLIEIKLTVNVHYRERHGD